jgi:hypothetical protein
MPAGGNLCLVERQNRHHVPAMLYIVVPFLVCIVGLVLWLGQGPKSSPIGKEMFWVGLLVTLLVWGHGSIRIP